jgi:uncharacterized protein (TIGR03435 family)
MRLPTPIRLFLTFVILTATPIAAAAQTPSPAFEVATIHLSPPNADPNTGHWSYPGIGRFSASHVSLVTLIKLAYDINASQIANQPGWLDSNLYDIDAKPEAGISLTREELKPRLQNLLRERFHLISHTETRSASGYALVVAEGGPHLTPTTGAHFPGSRTNISSGQMRGSNWSMTQFATYLTPAAGFPVVDETRLSGSYDISFAFNPKPDRDSDLPSLNEALKQATGLLLKTRKVPVETLVIDSIDKIPTPN